MGILRRKLGFTECYTQTRFITDIHAVGFELICHDEANEGWNFENRPLQNTGDLSVTEEQDAALVRSYRLNSTREVFRVR